MDMKRNLRILKGAVVILVACAGCCALPILLAGGVSGILAGELAALAKIHGWMLGVTIGAAVIFVGAVRLYRARQRKLT